MQSHGLAQVKKHSRHSGECRNDVLSVLSVPSVPSVPSVASVVSVVSVVSVAEQNIGSWFI